MNNSSSNNWNIMEDGLSFKELQNELDLIKTAPLSITNFDESQILSLAYHWRKYLIKQRVLVDIPDQRILVVGDIHGDLLHVQKALSLLDSDEVSVVIFDGDLIDRGAEMFECLATIIERQLSGENVYYLRGNHELKSINAVYGFRGYSTLIHGSRSYEYFSHAFQQLPLAAKVGEWAFITHGGVPCENIFFHLMRLDVKPKEPEKSNYAELIWNDPDPEIKHFGPSQRGSNCYRFGTVAFSNFMKFHALDLFVRAHQAFPKGYRWFFNKKLLSIFSSRAGPYSRVKPHYAILDQGKVEVVNAKTINL